MSQCTRGADIDANSQAFPQLRDIWDAQMTGDGAPTARLDVLSGLTKTTLDVIGLAGKAHTIIYATRTHIQYKVFLRRIWLPLQCSQPHRRAERVQRSIPGALLTPHLHRVRDHEEFLPHPGYHCASLRCAVYTAGSRMFATSNQPDEASKCIQRARGVMRRIGKELIAEKKTEIERELAEGREKKGVKRGDLQGRDLLTLLLKANMAMDIPDSQRLSDEDVLARASYFISSQLLSEVNHYVEVPTYAAL